MKLSWWNIFIYLTIHQLQFCLLNLDKAMPAYPGGTENADILAPVWGSIPNTCVASRWLMPQLKPSAAPSRTNPRASSSPFENRNLNTDGVLLQKTRQSGRLNGGSLHRRSQSPLNYILINYSAVPNIIKCDTQLYNSIGNLNVWPKIRIHRNSYEERGW